MAASKGGASQAIEGGSAVCGRGAEEREREDSEAAVEDPRAGRDGQGEEGEALRRAVWRGGESDDFPFSFSIRLFFCAGF